MFRRIFSTWRKSLPLKYFPKVNLDMQSGVAISAMSTYAILGCGSVGHLVADELSQQGKDVIIIDKDESRVEALRDQDLNAQLADISRPEIAEAVEGCEVVLILSSDIDANKAAVEAIRSANGNQFIVARASDPVSRDELIEFGADNVINPSTVIAESAIRAIESGELEYTSKRLTEILQRTEHRLAIITNENPDPDSIASAVALAAIAEHMGVDSDIFYLGDIGQQENRAFVNLLGIDLQQLDGSLDQALEDHDSVILVDAGLLRDGPLSIVPNGLIDHEELSLDKDEVAEFVDVRPNMSSTSTILTKYIQEIDVSVNEETATALLYGIRSETLDFKRDTRPADLTAAAFLYPFANHDTLEQVESPNMSPETLDVLAEAITNREVQGSHLVSNAGFVRDPEVLGQAAKHLLNLEGITTTAVFGVGENTIYLAARSKDIRVDIGRVLGNSFDEIGEVLGHSRQATVEIPLGLFTGIDTSDDSRETLLALTEEAVRRRLFDAMGVESGEKTNGG